MLGKVEDRYKKFFPLRSKENDVETTRERLKTENAAAKSIQRVFRRHLLMDEINLISNSKINIGLRARDKTINKIEQLVTVMWKTQKNAGGEDSDEENECETTDDEEDCEEEEEQILEDGQTPPVKSSEEENGVIENKQADTSDMV